jgi:pimeloyl-ACP methyl ester carboxylesterase
MERNAPLDQFFGRLSGTFPWIFYVPFSFIGLTAKWLSPQIFMKSIESSMSTADQVFVQREGMAEFFAEGNKEALRQGTCGPADDVIILYQDWGFQLNEINTPIHIFHGEDDKFAPFSYGKYLAENIPETTLNNYPDEGHFFVLHIFGDIFDFIEDF